MPLSDERLAEIRERVTATTDGPWVAEFSGEQGNCVVPHDAESTREAVCITRLYHQTADAEFIAHARQDVPDLLAAYDELRAEIEQLRAQVAAVEALTDGPFGTGYRPYVVDIPGEDILFAVGLDEIRAALASEGGDHAE